MSGHIGFVESELQSGVETKRDGVQQTTDGIELLASPRRPSRHRARPRRRPRRRIVNGRTAGALATPIEWSGPNHRRLRRRAAKAKVPYAACGTRADCSLFSRLFRAAVVSSHHPSCCHRRRGSSCASWRQLLGFRKKKRGCWRHVWSSSTLVLERVLLFRCSRRASWHSGRSFIGGGGILPSADEFYWRSLVPATRSSFSTFVESARRGRRRCLFCCGGVAATLSFQGSKSKWGNDNNKTKSNQRHFRSRARTEIVARRADVPGPSNSLDAGGAEKPAAAVRFSRRWPPFEPSPLRATLAAFTRTFLGFLHDRFFSSVRRPPFSFRVSAASSPTRRRTRADRRRLSRRRRKSRNKSLFSALRFSRTIS